MEHNMVCFDEIGSIELLWMNSLIWLIGKQSGRLFFLEFLFS